MKIVRYCLTGISLVLLFFVSLPISKAQEYSWSAVYSLIENRFPNTPTVDIETVERWQKSDETLFVDVRDEKEYSVSHLKRAKNWTSISDFQNVPKDKRILLYCSVGYRSAKLVHALQRKGYTQVYNFKGSIFAWVNAGKPVYLFEEKTPFVHPYNDIWGQLLNAKYHSYSTGIER